MRMQLYALPLLVIVAVVVGSVIAFATPVTITLTMQAMLIVFVPMIVVHELVHAIAHPGNGRSEKSLVGFWPSHLLFYAHYEGEMSRNRFLTILLMPTIVLTIIPLLFLIALRLDSKWLAALALANGVGACGDLLGVLLLVFQIPSNAIVRNKGWRTFWKPVETIGMVETEETEGADRRERR